MSRTHQPTRHDFAVRPQTAKFTLWTVAFAYVFIAWCFYARWVTGDHEDCLGAVTPECYHRVFDAPVAP